MELVIAHHREGFITRLRKPGVEPVYVRLFETEEEVSRYIGQIKLVYPDLEVIR